MTYIYFDHPVQVMFLDIMDSDDVHYSAGIGYKDEVICGCCGATFSIKDIEADAKELDMIPFYVFPEWITLTEEIQGGENEIAVLTGYHFVPLEQFVHHTIDPTDVELDYSADEKYEQIQFDIKN